MSVPGCWGAERLPARLNDIPSVILRRDVHVGCVPWQIADRQLGLAS